MKGFAVIMVRWHHQLYAGGNREKALQVFLSSTTFFYFPPTAVWLACDCRGEYAEVSSPVQGSGSQSEDWSEDHDADV